MIPIYIASSDRFAQVERAIQNSILDNTNSKTHIQIIRPQYVGMSETGCTGFTNVRFAIPELLRRDGYDFGIYFDVDMLILGDVDELFSYAMDGRYVCMKDGSTEVAVVSADIRLPEIPSLSGMNKHELMRMLPRSDRIPDAWNVEDRYIPEAKLIHFTDLNRQPWFYNNHPDQQAVALYEYYANAQESV